MSMFLFCSHVVSCSVFDESLVVDSVIRFEYTKIISDFYLVRL